MTSNKTLRDRWYDTPKAWKMSVALKVLIGALMVIALLTLVSGQ